MTYPPGTVTIQAPAFRTVEDAQAWAERAFACIKRIQHDMNKILVEARKNPAAAIADVDTSEDPADAPASADALRDDLVANYLPYILGKINSILSALRTNGIVEE